MQEIIANTAVILLLFVGTGLWLHAKYQERRLR